jgi:hypothetical protein
LRYLDFEIITALSAYSTTAFQDTKSLSFCAYDMTNPGEDAQKGLVEGEIYAAISSLKNLESIR